MTLTENRPASFTANALQRKINNIRHSLYVHILTSTYWFEICAIRLFASMIRIQGLLIGNFYIKYMKYLIYLLENTNKESAININLTSYFNTHSVRVLQSRKMMCVRSHLLCCCLLAALLCSTAVFATLLLHCQQQLLSCWQRFSLSLCC